MDVVRLRDGLWRWTAPHPEWTPGKGGPGGWEESVGCLYYEPTGDAPAEAIVLIDPLVPPAGTEDEARFWRALDRDVDRRGLRVCILLGNGYHTRSARVLLERYGKKPGAEIRAHEAVAGKSGLPLASTFSGETRLPSGILGYPLPGLGASEVAYFIPHCGALAFADAVIGAGNGRVRIAPASWGDDSDAGRERYRREFRPALRRLLDLPFEILAVSHGEPVLAAGRSALEEALGAAAWGED